MKVLQLCYKPPYPAVDGGCMGMNNVTQGLLKAGHEVHVLTIESDKHPVQHSAIPPDYEKQTRFKAIYVDLRIHPIDAAFALLCGDSYNVKRYESKDFGAALTDILLHDSFDVVQMESIYLTPYIATVRQHSTARVVLHAPNVEHQIWLSAAKLCRKPLKRWYLKHLALALGSYEREMCRKYDGIVCVTRKDADFFRQQGCRHILVKPFGIELCDRQISCPSGAAAEDGTGRLPGTGHGNPPVQNGIATRSPQELKLYHIGSMDWDANLQSIRWFLKEVWPGVRTAVPQARLYLAGRKMPRQMMEAQVDGVTMVGEVANADDFIADKQINVVPLLFGSGIRVKIIESMAMGKVVISTHIGADGIDYSDGDNILIADTASDFMHQIQRLAQDPALLRRLALNARHLAEARYDNSVLTQQLADFYGTLHSKTAVP